MKGVHPPASDQTVTPRAEVIEVGLGFEESAPQSPAKRKGRWALLRAGALVAVVVAGLALVPGNDQAPSTVTVDMTLQKPAVATTAATDSPGVVSVVTDNRFPLIPVADLNGFARIAGPVQFADRYWVAGTPPGADGAVVLSSEDGKNWVVESELVGPDQVVRVEDLIVFESRLAAFATSSGSLPTPQRDIPEALLAWTSGDGRSWFPQQLPGQEGVAYWDVTAVAGGDQVMIWAGSYEAYGDLIYPAIPAEFGAALAAGQLFVSLERRSDSLRVIVMAPPGLVVFSTEVPVSSPQLMYPSRLYRSEDLAVWNEVDPSMAAGWGLSWSEDFGFVLQSMNGGTTSSSDGREWQSTILPSANFWPWRSGLVALVDRDLVFIDDGGETRIHLPDEMFVGNSYPWIEVGPSTMIAAATIYTQGNSTPQVVSGDLLLTWTGNNLIVSEGTTERVRIPLYNSPSFLPFTYDLVAESMVIDPGDDQAEVTIPLEDLAAFWSDSQPGRIDLYQSPDGLVWSKAESALFSSNVTLIGAIEDGFLIGLGGISDLGVEEPMTVFRTGPVD